MTSQAYWLALHRAHARSPRPAMRQHERRHQSRVMRETPQILLVLQPDSGRVQTCGAARLNNTVSRLRAQFVAGRRPQAETCGTVTLPSDPTAAPDECPYGTSHRLAAPWPLLSRAPLSSD